MQALVVGCGLSGAVAARKLADLGYQVTILERRDHIGGNMYDYTDDHGILVHKYGPHTFHTNKKHLIDYLSRYAEWLPFKLTCGAVIQDKCTPTPFNFQTIDDFYPKDAADNLKKHISREFPDREFATVVEIMNCQDSVVREFGEFLFHYDYRPYTAKQWGLPPESIDPSILKRVPIRFSYGIGYFDDKYQIMPKLSYHNFFVNLLDCDNITIHLGVDALSHIRVNIKKKQLELDGNKIDFPVIYTGAIDELFHCCYGRLPYRSLKFDFRYEEIDSKQNMPVVAYPQENFTRITEYKKLPIQNISGTTYAIEYSIDYEYGKNEPYYPVLTVESKKQFDKYNRLAMSINNLICCGRLANFKYYNMDNALDNVLSLEILQ